MPRDLVAGDVVPGGISEPAFGTGNGERSVGDLLVEFIGLEFPLLEAPNPYT
jgi:hypothetical protein